MPKPRPLSRIKSLDSGIDFGVLSHPTVYIPVGVRRDDENCGALFGIGSSEIQQTTGTGIQQGVLLPKKISLGRTKGFTLLEMIITLVVVGIMAAVGGQMLGSGVNAYNATTESLEMLGKVSYAMGRMTKEIRETRYTGAQFDIGPFNATNLQFTKTDGVTVTFATALPNVTLGYSTPNVGATLTDQTSSLNFNYYQANGVTPAASVATIAFIEVSLTLDLNGTLYPLRTRVSLRNNI